MSSSIGQKGPLNSLKRMKMICITSYGVPDDQHSHGRKCSSSTIIKTIKDRRSVALYNTACDGHKSPVNKWNFIGFYLKL